MRDFGDLSGNLLADATATQSITATCDLRTSAAPPSSSLYYIRTVEAEFVVRSQFGPFRSIQRPRKPRGVRAYVSPARRSPSQHACPVATPRVRATRAWHDPYHHIHVRDFGDSRSHLFADTTSTHALRFGAYHYKRHALRDQARRSSGVAAVAVGPTTVLVHTVAPAPACRPRTTRHLPCDCRCAHTLGFGLSMPGLTSRGLGSCRCLEGRNASAPARTGVARTTVWDRLSAAVASNRRRRRTNFN